MPQLQWAHNSVGDTSKSKVALKKCSNHDQFTFRIDPVPQWDAQNPQRDPQAHLPTQWSKSDIHASD